MTYVGDHSELASFAIRLFNLICNSVPSERAWSVMNIIQTPIRGNLGTKKTTKCLYIYINQRQLDKLGSKLSYSTMPDIEEEQQVEFKDMALDRDIDGDDDDIKDVRELVDEEDE